MNLQRSCINTLPTSIDAPVHAIIARQVRGQPDAQSVCAWDASFTYRELDNLSSRLASRLRMPDVDLGPGTLVPPCFEKSAWTVVAIMGVMKAGGAVMSHVNFASGLHHRL